MVDPLRVRVDYTSRDYMSLRNDLITMIQAKLSGWSADNTNDFALALIEAMAYGLDGVHYMLDRVANEAYLPTATQRDSLYGIASMFNYTPFLATPAYVDLVFTNNSDTAVTIPKGTRCQATIEGATGTVVKNFETNAEAVIPGKLDQANSTEPVVMGGIGATEGRTWTAERIGKSNGYIKQEYPLGRMQVLAHSTSIEVVLEDVVTTWSEIDSLTEAGPFDRVFETVRLTDETTVVRFGDGQNGQVPDLWGIILATYRTGGGEEGNVARHSINAIVEPVLDGVSVDNIEPARGGTNAESLESIRLNAARSFRHRDRAVTIADYQAVALNSPDVTRAKAIGNNGSSVTVYIVPNNTEESEPDNDRPMPDEETLGLVTDWIGQRSMAGVTVQVFGPSWIPVYLHLRISCAPSAYQSEVDAAVRQRIDSLYGFNGVAFNPTIRASDITLVTTGIKGMDAIEVLAISKDPNFEEPEGSTRIPNEAITLADPVNAVAYIDAIRPFSPPAGSQRAGTVLTDMVGGLS